MLIMATPDNQWHLDKKVPLTLIIVIAGQIALGIVWAADMRKDIELLKASDKAVHEQMQFITKVSDSSIKLIQEQLTRIDMKMDRLIERKT